MILHSALGHPHLDSQYSNHSESGQCRSILEAASSTRPEARLAGSIGKVVVTSTRQYAAVHFRGAEST